MDMKNLDNHQANDMSAFLGTSSKVITDAGNDTDADNDTDTDKSRKQSKSWAVSMRTKSKSAKALLSLKSLPKAPPLTAATSIATASLESSDEPMLSVAEDPMAQVIQKINEQHQKGEISAEERDVMMAQFVQTPRTKAQEKVVFSFSFLLKPLVLLFVRI
jgi:hypothetical protein